MIVILPNLLSLARLGCVPVVIWCVLEGAYGLAFWVFLGAGISDALDGLIAKRFDAATEFGAYLDALADKALLVGTYVALALRGEVPLWLTIMVVFRDLLIVGGALTVNALTPLLRVEPMMLSKVNTALQIGLVAVVIGKRAFELPVPAVVEAGVWLVAATTVLSGVAYVVTWMRRVAAWERDRGDGD